MQLFNAEVDCNYNPVDNTVNDNNITPMDVIRSMAHKLNQDINDPNPKCKYCFGRGYIGRDSISKAPIPCDCLFKKDISGANEFAFNKLAHRNRSQRRKFK